MPEADGVKVISCLLLILGQSDSLCYTREGYRNHEDRNLLMLNHMKALLIES